MSDLPLTRKSLLLALSERSDEAWAEFLSVYEQAIVSYCMRRGLQQADALDAAQGVYAAIHKRIATWDMDDSRGSFRAWLFRTARNITIDLLAANSKLPTARGDTQNVEALAQVHDHRSSESLGLGEEQTTAFQLELQRALFEWASRQARSEVRAVTWQAFRATALDGQRPDVVAQELQISVGSVYTAKCRVMARIRELTEQWGPDTDLISDQWQA